MIDKKILIDHNHNYYIKSNGELWSIKNNIRLKTRIDKCGYELISLTNAHKKLKNLFIHRLVGYYFIPNPSGLPQINHIDGNKLNNQINNLEWCDNKHNNHHKNTILRKSSSNELYIHFKNSCKKWYCLIPYNGARKFIGYFDLELDAIKAKYEFLSKIVD